MSQTVLKPQSIQLDPVPATQQDATYRNTTPTEQNIENQLVTPSEIAVFAQATLTLPVITKLISAGFAFFVAGTNDGGLAFSGWILVALVGGFVRACLGSGGVMVLGALLQLCSFVLRFWFPPFSVFTISSYLLSALGTAFQDAQANTFVTSVKAAHRWLGIIHAGYGIGCVVGPLVAAGIASSDSQHWKRFYFFPMGLAILNFGLASWAFRREFLLARGQSQQEGRVDKSRVSEAWEEMRAILKEKSVWLISLFFFFHLGVAITAGGWLVEFLVTERNGKLSQVGFLPTVLYAGVALGRLLLVEPTHRFGERKMLLIYSVLCLALQIISWRVKTIASSATAICLMGFLLGPFFAAGITVGTRLVPPKLITPALGIIFGMAQAGGTIFPAMTGIIAQKSGVAVLQPMLVGLIVLMGVAWALVPPVKQRDN